MVGVVEICMQHGYMKLVRGPYLEGLPFFTKKTGLQICCCGIEDRLRFIVEDCGATSVGAQRRSGEARGDAFLNNSR